MKEWKKILISPSDSIRDAIAAINSESLQIALVIDTNSCLIGTITDGDVRRGILANLSLDDSVEKIMNTTPITVSPYDSREAVLSLMKIHLLHQIPIVDEEKRLVGLEIGEELVGTVPVENWVVLMVGGIGNRLRPLTEQCPKPLLKIGNKPLLEIIIENFIEQGFHQFFLAVNYKAEMIKNFFGDGSSWNVEIRYLHENYPMGTAGALSLLPELPSHPLIIMNGDLLTKANFRQLLNFHNEHQAHGTMCVRDYDFQVPFGVVKTNHQQILRIDEKPTHRFFVNAGIYVLDPLSLQFVPSDSYFDMPDLFQELITHHRETIVFPIREYWMDIGHMDDFQRANGEFDQIFNS